jgi:hypothetical protein
MKLFIATGIFHPESGGPATYLHGLLPAVQAAGHDRAPADVWRSHAAG